MIAFHDPSGTPSVTVMTTYALIHGGGDGGWSWHLVEAELRSRGHRTVAPDLPADDETATLSDYADFVVDAIGDTDDDVVVVGHSFGGFTAALVAARRPVSGLVFLAGMIPRPGEPPADWWTNTGYAGSDDDEDPRATYYHDVPDALADEAMARERQHPSEPAYTQPWPLDTLPDVPVRAIVCTEDRLFAPGFLRGVVRDRLGVEPEDLAGGHCVALAHPKALADLLTR